MSKRAIKPNDVIVTDSDYEIFKTEADYWIKFFGLSDVEVFYNIKELDGIVAMIETDNVLRGTVMTISSKFPKVEYSENSIRKAAFHEVCELFLSDVAIYSNNLTHNDDEKIVLEREIHKIIRRLESSVFYYVHNNAR